MGLFYLKNVCWYYGINIQWWSPWKVFKGSVKMFYMFEGGREKFTPAEHFNPTIISPRAIIVDNSLIVQYMCFSWKVYNDNDWNDNFGTVLSESSLLHLLHWLYLIIITMFCLSGHCTYVMWCWLRLVCALDLFMFILYKVFVWPNRKQNIDWVTHKVIQTSSDIWCNAIHTL